MKKLMLKIQEKWLWLSNITVYEILDTLSVILGIIICLFSITIAVISRFDIVEVPDFLMSIGFFMFPCGIFVLLIGVVRKL